MNKETMVRIAYRCPECTDTIVGFVGKYALKADMLRLKCGTCDEALEIKIKEAGKLELSVPCILCKQNHTYTVAEGLVFDKDLFSLACPYSNVDIAFSGKEEEVSEALTKNAEQLSALVSSLEAEDIRELQPMELGEDEILPDAAVYDTLRFLLKDLEADGAVKCPCRNGEYDLRFTEGGIQAYCKRCGATYDFHAATPALAEEYLSVSSLELK